MLSVLMICMNVTNQISDWTFSPDNVRWHRIETLVQLIQTEISSATVNKQHTPFKTVCLYVYVIAGGLRLRSP